jgi:[ribosomal protein S5]-alanine N-acetyltransferase
MRLETERLILREFRATDWHDVHVYSSDPEVVRWFPFGPNTESETRAFVASQASQTHPEPRAFFDLVIALRDVDRVIGSCFLKLEGEPEPTGFITYLLARTHWGKGYATETARALLRYAFEQGAHRVFTYCDVQNPASARVLEKLGMRREALLLEHVWYRERWHDEYVYAILRREWIELQLQQ